MKCFLSVGILAIMLSACHIPKPIDMTTINQNPNFSTNSQTEKLGKINRSNGEENPHGIALELPNNSLPIISDWKSDYTALGSLRAPEIRPHTGIDFGGPTGFPILAAADGEVIASFKDWGSGNSTIIKHGKLPNGNFIASVYVHANENLTIKGDLVKRGQPIATIGKTGYYLAVSHLHFSTVVWENDFNPYQWWEYLDNPHKYWLNGPGKMPCFSPHDDYSNSGYKFTLPVACN